MSRPMHQHQPGALEATVRALLVGQHLILAALLTSTTVRALADGSAPLAVLPTVAAFTVWYSVARRPLARSPYVWLPVLTLLWLLLVTISPEFVWVAFSLWLLAGQELPLRVALGYSAITLGVVVLRPLGSSGPPSWAEIIGPVIGAVFAVGLARGQVQLVRDARERARLTHQVLEATEETAALQDELSRTQHEAGQLAERTRLSREIHDTLAQGFSSIVLLSRAGSTAPDPGRAGELFTQITRTARENLDEARRLVAALTPASWDEDGLVAALRRLAARHTEETGSAATVRLAGADPVRPELSTVAEVALLRIAQAALANVRTHASAGQVVLTLSVTETEVRLDTVDDGIGFDTGQLDLRAEPSLAGGYGLRASRARMRQLEGDLTVESTPRCGTTVTAWLPARRAVGAMHPAPEAADG